jgi:hypothetical protein
MCPRFAFAPAGTGVNILSAVYSTAERRFHFQMFHFDSQANLLVQHHGTIPVRPDILRLVTAKLQ